GRSATARRNSRTWSGIKVATQLGRRSNCWTIRHRCTGRGSYDSLDCRVKTRYELQRTQKVENVLLLAVQERIEVLDHDVRFGSVEGKDTPAAMRPDRFPQFRRSAIVQKEQPLSQPPQRGRAKLSWSGLSLPDTIGQAWAHVVNQQVGVETHRLIAQRRNSGITSVERGRMTE